MVGKGLRGGAEKPKQGTPSQCASAPASDLIIALAFLGWRAIH